jgi:hypothetical protein
MTELAKTPGTHPTFALFMQKAAQRNFLDALAEVAGPVGVHVARSEINGIVADEEPELNANDIAEGLYRLSRQGKEEWESRVVVGSVEEFVKKMSGGQ